MSNNILFIDDDSDACLALIRALKATGLNAALHAASNAEKALKLATELDPHVFVLDLCLDERIGVQSGFNLLSQIRANYPRARIIMLTGHSDVEYGVQALQKGAASFLQKPADLQHLMALLKDGIVQAEIQRNCYKLEQQNKFQIESFIVGKSKAVQSLREQILFLGTTQQSVFISGETGVGKGVCAMAIHRFGKRSSARLVRYQATYTSGDMVNSDLFGHKKGAFTGASDDRHGLIADAQLGSLFIDEIDELPIEVQVALLGVLQDHKYRQVGSDRELESDFRLITASNCQIDKAISQGKLRKDFYHRIAHAMVVVPPLRDRKEDILVLSEHMLRELCAQEELNVFDITQDALALLHEYHFPGNVRELEAIVQSAAYHASYQQRSVITPEDIRLNRSYESNAVSSMTGDFNFLVEEYKLKLIDDALARCGGNQVKAAQELKLDRTTMRRIMKRHES